MPEQVFTDEDGDEVLLVRWDFAMSAVEVHYRGTPLARIGEITVLRSDLGMTGPTPDGRALTLWAVRTTGAESFEAQLDDTVLRPSPATWSANPDEPFDPATLRRSDRKALRRQEDEIRLAQGRGGRRRRPVIMILTLTAALGVAGVLYGWPKVQKASATAAPAVSADATPVS